VAAAARAVEDARAAQQARARAGRHELPIRPTGWGSNSGAEDTAENGFPTNTIVAPTTTAPVLPDRAYAPAADAPTAVIVRPSAAAFADQSPPTTPSQLSRYASWRGLRAATRLSDALTATRKDSGVGERPRLPPRR
jgi:hypothetical protein